MGVRFGRYELLGLLGRGGMAEVFLARYTGPEGFEKRLVIKRVLPQLGGERRFLRLFFDEARTQVSLSHGNLVPVFDFGRVGNAYFIAMEHVPGCDLGALLSAARKLEQPLPPRLVAYIGGQLLRGLDYVHRRGFVHRDLAPRNVLLSRDGEVKLSDFGVALAATHEVAGVRGTLAYMAPEQARGERIDGRADLYALGLVLAEALTGKRVRPTADDEETQLANARNGGPAVVEGPLAAVIARATAAAPADRFADAESMLLALDAVALERGTIAPARELAARVADASAEIAEASDAPTELPAGTAATVGEETYFRDNESASFVEELLPPPRARSRWVVAAGASGAVAAVIAGVLAWRAVGHERATAIAPPAAPVVVASQPAPPPVAAPPVAAPPVVAPPVIAPPAVAPTRRRAVAPTPPPAASGSLQVRCTPWCVPFVDGQRRGDDGRNHTLSLPAGTHKLRVERLDDNQEQVVRIDAGATRTVDFKFE